MTQWTRQPQERDGTYRFSGQFLVTKEVNQTLFPDEILSIYLEIQEAVKENDGLDYLQVFTNEQGQKLYFIDQLNEEMLASGDHEPDHDHCTLLFAYEY